MKTRTKIVIGIVLGIVIICLISTMLPQTRSIHEYMPAGGGLTFGMGGFGSRLVVRLTSVNGYMYVKIVVDGTVVYEKSRTYKVDFERNLGFGWHEIDVTIYNSIQIGYGPAIIVEGEVSYLL